MSETPPLVTDANIDDPDGFYARLIEAHRDLTDAESRQLNARLILLLANHIGERAVLESALAQARAGLRAPSPQTEESAERGD
ncbi:MAG: DUF2783 domain-containing protein [Marivibrio sp.]|uniref:DUF2783 domain-containing protein n=1 Tax=Marivibrio sp. TaxID=2039719 RepID=UPI0032ECC65C